MIDATPALLALAPDMDAGARAEWSAALNPAMASAGLSSHARVALFMGQCAQESGRFTRLVESLDYETAERIHAVFPSEFPAVDDAVPYLGVPEALANRVYAGKLGNGDAGSGDGWRFRGRGLIQVTGRGPYTLASAALKIPLQQLPDWMTTPRGAVLSALWWWGGRPDHARR